MNIKLLSVILLLVNSIYTMNEKDIDLTKAVENLHKSIKNLYEAKTILDPWASVEESFIRLSGYKNCNGWANQVELAEKQVLSDIQTAQENIRLMKEKVKSNERYGIGTSTMAIICFGLSYSDSTKGATLFDSIIQKGAFCTAGILIGVFGIWGSVIGINTSLKKINESSCVLNNYECYKTRLASLFVSLKAQSIK